MSVGPLRSVAAVVGALICGIATAIGGALLSFPVPLHTVRNCVAPPCVSNAPVLYPFPFIVGLALAGLTLSSGASLRAILVRGLSLGFAAQFIGALFDVGRVSLQDPYVATPYRIYALLYVATVLGATAAALHALARSARLPAQLLPAFLLPVLAASVYRTIAAGELGLAAVGSAAVVAGWSAPTLIPARATSWRRPDPLLLIVAAAVLARVAFGLLTLSRTGPGLPFALGSDDGDSYYHHASRLAKDWGLLPATLAAPAFPPAYSLFVAAIFALTRESMAALIVAQSILAGASALLLYLIVKSGLGRAAGLLAASLYALDANLIQNQSTMTAEALLMPLLLLCFWAFQRYCAGRDVRWLVLCAIGAGAAFVTRNVAAMPMIAGIASWIVGMHRRRPLRMGRDLSVLLAALLLASAPVAWATATIDGRPRLTTQLAGLAWNFEGGPRDGLSNAPLVERGIDPFADPVGSAGIVARDPLAVARFWSDAVPYRWQTLFFSYVPGTSDPLVLVNPVTSPNRFGDLVSFTRLVAVLVAIAAVVYRRRLPRALVPLVIGSLLYLLVFGFVFPPYHPFRYKIPLEPLRLAAESFGLLWLGGTIVRSWSARPRPVSATR